MSDDDKNPCCGPGYKSPEDAIKSPREDLIYVVCVNPFYKNNNKPDYLATVDVDPKSPTYSKVIHRLPMSFVGDELHHTGWNACSSCYNDSKRCRNRLILASFNSDRIYVVDIGCNLRAPKMHKVIDPENVHKLDVIAPHTVHCIPSGEVMISCLGDNDGNGKGSFILLDGKDFDITGTWENEGDSTEFGYDFWYQPKQNIMVSSGWGAPSAFRAGFKVEDVENGKYGTKLHFWNWDDQTFIKSIELGDEGLMALEVRFLHNPEETIGYVGCTLSSNIFIFFKDENDEWKAEKVIDVPNKKVEGWLLKDMPGVITDILVSMDDKYLYLSNWVHGDVRQYDITDRHNPKWVGKLQFGGSIYKGGPVKVIEDKELKDQPPRLTVKGKTIYGGPQMMQLSLDGKRLYITNSLYSTWDRQFYPELVQNGSAMVQIDVNIEDGGLTINEDFLINFGREPDGPFLAHEMRFPGGDSTSDIWC